jgi:hypothetical protein
LELRMGKLVRLFIVVAGLLIAAPGPAYALDNGAISVDSGGDGRLFANQENGESVFDEAGLAIRVGSANYGIGGTSDFTYVDTPSESSTTVTNEYKIPSPELDVTETITLPASGNAFTVEYAVNNPSTGSSVTFLPKMLADLTPGGQTEGIGVNSPALGARSEDANSRITAPFPAAAGPPWFRAQEGDYDGLRTTALAGGSFTDGAFDTSVHDAGLGIEFAQTQTLSPGQTITYRAVFTLQQTLQLSPQFDDEVVGSTATVHVFPFDANGSPDPSAHIVYRVDGANPHGVATVSGGAVSYTGTNAGEDDVHIWKDTTANGVRDPNEAEQVAHVTWHTPPHPPQAATDLAGAMSSQSGLVTGASYVTAPPGRQDQGPADSVFTSALDGFPLDGSTFALLTNGDADGAPLGGPVHGGDADGGAYRGANDVTTLKVDVDVPSNASCLSFDFRFLSAEVPGTFNDAFLAELDSDDWSVDSSDVISAPHNFAFDPSGKPITVNGTGATESTAANAAGTNYGLATGILRASTPVAPGAHSVYLSIFDIRDSIVDSAAFVDNLHTSALPPEQCKPGAIDAASAPSEALPGPTTPAQTTPPVTNRPTVVIGLQSDPTDLIGNTHTAAVVGTPAAHVRWTVAGVNPASGTLTIGADGRGAINWKGAKPGRDVVTAFVDVNGNGVRDGDTEPQQTATVDWLAPPVVGKSVNVAPVEGTVLVKLPKRANARKWKLSPAATKGFVPLSMAQQVPVGSTLDTTRGRIQMQTAQTAGSNVKTQSGEFYQGVFEFTQPKSKNPITTLTLNGALSCTGSGGKKALAKKKKAKSRGLWGSDHGGRFRTRGRHSSATVRGTEWFTKDTCTTTTTVVRKGSVTVQDFAKKKKVVVKQGHKYVARARAASKTKKK